MDYDLFNENINLLVLDLDGVITDGTVTISDSGKEYKRFSYQDLDAITKAHLLGLDIAIVTAEDTPIVKIIADRFNIKKVIKGSKDKLESIESLAKDNNISMDNICYVADGDRDVPALEKVGLSFCPINGTENAKTASSNILHSSGGNGAIKEIIDYLYKNNNV